MDKWQALDAFWNSFEWPAFDENSVPEYIDMGGGVEKLKPPYITYESAVGKLDDTLSLSASLWDNSTSWMRISKKADEIAGYIQGIHPVTMIDGGRMWIVAGNPFAQRLSGGDEPIKRILININVEFFTAS